MANQYKNNPTWIETKLYTATKDSVEDCVHTHELVLDPNKFAVYFFGNKTTFNAQEYKFLKAILTKKGERVSANKLMKQIKSQCKPELMKKLSYRIKSKIKAKLKRLNIAQLELDGNDWILVDQFYEQNMMKDGFGHVIYFQNFDFNRYFDMLISVKDGYYFTSFVEA